MDHYIDIRSLPDPEFGETLLMNALFAKLHRALVSKGNGKIGVSFPEARKTLGGKLRLHGNKSALNKLMELDWIKGLRDYTSISEIKTVPEHCSYRIVKRKQVKSSIERLYRRSVKNGKITLKESEEKISNARGHNTKQPFVQLTSSSTGQKFRLFIDQSNLFDLPCGGVFSGYGLSDKATIPWF